MRYINKIWILSIVMFTLHSCTEMVEGINENPNDLTVEDVSEVLFLTEVNWPTFNCNVGI